MATAACHEARQQLLILFVQHERRAPVEGEDGEQMLLEQHGDVVEA
jgi:hypothetical protein